MSGLALALALGAAVAHATWNLLFKQTAGGITFAWLCSLAATLLYFPGAAADIAARGADDLAILAPLALVSGGIHLVYLLVLQRAYASGDLSLVYPLSRGLGAMLTATLAILLLGEHPSLVGALGIAVVVGGAAMLAWPQERRMPQQDVVLATATALLIAAYTLWDKYAVDDQHLSPIVFLWCLMCAQTILLTLVAGRALRSLRQTVRDAWRPAVAFGVLAPTSYTLTLFALTLAPASYVAPARETSVLIGAVLGTSILGEEGGMRRVAAALAIVAGVATPAAA
jgi:drug/metabolite transporter (DMT)-like permease